MAAALTVSQAAIEAGVLQAVVVEDVRAGRLNRISTGKAPWLATGELKVADDDAYARFVRSHWGGNPSQARARNRREHTRRLKQRTHAETVAARAQLNATGRPAKTRITDNDYLLARAKYFELVRKHRKRKNTTVTSGTNSTALITIADASKRTGATTNQILDLIKTGRVNGYRSKIKTFGGVRIPETDLAAIKTAVAATP